ncbi:MAG: hypothetical protein QM750_19875 [Rubrivivax sp.]
MVQTHASQAHDDGITPTLMRASGVPLALARWYHLTGRNLRKFTEWDVERIMQVRLQVALAAPRG